MKIISFNLGYFLGYNGSKTQYLRKPKKIIKADKKQERENIQEFLELVEEEQPDVLATQEIDKGSIRSNLDDQANLIEGSLSHYSMSYSCKYSGILGSIPLTRKLGNALFFQNGRVRNHRLSGGQKDLVQELVMENLSIFSLHMATFGQFVRRRQIRSLSKILSDKENYLVVGDWNTHNGQKEINYIREKLGCKVESPGKTFPADKPSRKLDLVAYKGIEADIERMGNKFSDHLPIKINLSVDF